MYWEKVDWWGHEEGPFGANVTARVREVDQMLNDLMDSLHDTDDINMVMFSDHGMAERVKDNPFINVLDYISIDDIYKAYGSKSGPVLQIWPIAGKLDQVRCDFALSSIIRVIFLKDVQRIERRPTYDNVQKSRHSGQISLERTLQGPAVVAGGRRGVWYP